MSEDPPRVYLVCRTDLDLSPGKLAIQAFHAGTGLLTRLPDDVRRHYESDPMRRAIALRAASAEKLEKARAAAAAAGLAHHLQVDAGFTEIPADTPTVLAFGPVRRADLPKPLQRLQAL